MKALFFLSALLCALSGLAREKKLILHTNGKVQYEYEMEGFLLDGKFACYYESGKLRVKGQFVSNQKTGIWRFWDEKGMLRCERNYRNNQEFTVIRLYDSTGARLNTTATAPTASCDYKDYLFSHRYVSSINRDVPANAELFAPNGLIDGLLKEASAGKTQIFSEDRFTQALASTALPSVDVSKVVSVLVKETYYWCSREQTLNSKVLGICPVVMDKGGPRELGWFYAPDITINTAMVSRLQNHQYASTVVSTTVKDAAFTLHGVPAKDNDLLRLLLIEMEANAVLYAIDYNEAWASNQ